MLKFWFFASMQAKYEENLRNAQQTTVVTTQEEKKEEPDKRRVSSASTRDTRCKRKVRIGDAAAPTTRNYRVELTAKDKEIQLLQKQLEELKKTNKKLAQDKGKMSSGDLNAVQQPERLCSTYNSQISIHSFLNLENNFDSIFRLDKKRNGRTRSDRRRAKRMIACRRIVTL